MFGPQWFKCFSDPLDLSSDMKINYPFNLSGGIKCNTSLKKIIIQKLLVHFTDTASNTLN